MPVWGLLGTSDGPLTRSYHFGALWTTCSQTSHRWDFDGIRSGLAFQIPTLTWCAPGDSNHPTCGLRIRCSTVELGAPGNHMNSVEGPQAVFCQPGTGCWPFTPTRCISGSVVCRRPEIRLGPE